MTSDSTAGRGVILALSIVVVLGGAHLLNAPAASCGEHAHGSGGEIANAIAVLQPTEGTTVAGVVRFRAEGGKVHVTADVTGLTPGATHAIHVHELGDLTARDGTSAGGHYNPEGHPHAGPETAARHAGDLGNLRADTAGRAHYELVVDNLTIAGDRNPVLGRSVIVHAGADDFTTQPTGDAGGRVAMGVIGVATAPAE